MEIRQTDKTAQAGTAFRPQRGGMRWLSYTAAIALLAYLIGKANWSAMWAILEHANRPLVAVMIVLAHTQFLLAAIIWRRFLIKGEIFLSLRYLTMIYIIGNFFSTMLPSRYSGDLYRAYAAGQSSARYYTAAASVLLERLSGMFVLLLMGLAASLFARHLLVHASLIYPIVGVFVVFSAGTALLFTKAAFNVVDRVLRTIRLFRLVRPMERFHAAVMEYRGQHGFLLKTNMIAFAFKTFAFVCIWVGARALGLTVSFQALVLVMPLIYVMEAAPISIYGMGIREGAFIFFFTQVGLTYEQAFALSIVVLFGRFCSAVTGGILYVLSRGTAPSPADAIRQVTKMGRRETDTLTEFSGRPVGAMAVVTLP